MSTSVPDIQSKAFQRRIETLYDKSERALQTERYTKLAERAQEAFKGRPRFFSSPGRTELGGNHTDHNRGRVLCAAVTLDALAAVVPTEEPSVEVWSEGWERPFRVDLTSLAPVDAERGATEALIRGIAEGLAAAGYGVGGFKAIVDSQVLPGSGLSSSAAIELLFGSIFSGLYNKNRIPFRELAAIGQQAENRHFGKPCGLMDQMASAAGGILFIDFEDPDRPAIKRLKANFNKEGYALTVVATGGTHADLREDYASIPQDMRTVASVFGKETLRGLKKDLLLRKLPEVREAAGDRAALRALHFIDENERVLEMVKALEDNRMKRYLKLVKRSGSSSWRFLQNVTVPRDPRDQSVALVLALTESFLGKDGACRIHGGGFAGTIQAYIPLDRLNEYREYMEGFLGRGSVTVLHLRNEGACELEER